MDVSVPVCVVCICVHECMLVHECCMCICVCKCVCVWKGYFLLEGDIICLCIVSLGGMICKPVMCRFYNVLADFVQGNNFSAQCCCIADRIL